VLERKVKKEEEKKKKKKKKKKLSPCSPFER
jgi:hypothetical protein